MRLCAELMKLLDRYFLIKSIIENPLGRNRGRSPIPYNCFQWMVARVDGLHSIVTWCIIARESILCPWGVAPKNRKISSLYLENSQMDDVYQIILYKCNTAYLWFLSLISSCYKNTKSQFFALDKLIHSIPGMDFFKVKVIGYSQSVTIYN
jgi:hypothetical protein